MIGLAREKTDLLSLAIVLALILGAVAVSVLFPAAMPWSFLVLAGAAVLLYWSVRWEITLWPWIWVLSYGLLDWPQWRLESAAFFNMTVPRFVFLAAVLAFGLHFMLRKDGLRLDRSVLWVMLVLAVYCTASAAVAGWTIGGVPASARGAPYFRLLGPIIFPFIMFFCVYNCTRDKKQISRALILLSIYGWYALYIGYLQYAAIMGAEGARSLIWPAYINNPNLLFAHHFDRARGAFFASNPQANLLLVLFFADLYLIRRIRGPYRAALIVQAVLIPPAIFFTGLRAAYLSFALCGIIWCLWGCKGRLGKTKLALASLAVMAGVTMFWGHLTAARRPAPMPVAPERRAVDRATGVVVQTGPIMSRLVLLSRTAEMVGRRPLTGVGFGHYMEADRTIERDPSSLSAFSGAVTSISTPANLFLVLAAETGIIGLVLIVAIFVLIFRQSLFLYRKTPSALGPRPDLLSRDLAVLFWIVMVVYLVDATFVDILWDVPSNGLFWAFAGLVVGYNRLTEKTSYLRKDQPHPTDAPVVGAILKE